MSEYLVKTGTRIRWVTPYGGTPYLGTINRINHDRTLPYEAVWDGGGISFLSRNHFTVIINPNDILKQIL